MAFGLQQPAPIRAARHLRLNLVRNHVAAFANLPAAAQCPIHGDEAERDVALVAGERILDRQLVLLSADHSGVIGLAAFVLNERQFGGAPGSGRCSLAKAASPSSTSRCALNTVFW